MRDENPDQVVNSKVVNGAIRAQIRPLLKEHGFVKFTSRTSWRFTEQTIHVLNFQSFNSYLAEGVGSTTYSFAINLGCYIKAIPSRLGCFKQENGYLMPPEYA